MPTFVAPQDAGNLRQQWIKQYITHDACRNQLDRTDLYLVGGYVCLKKCFPLHSMKETCFTSVPVPPQYNLHCGGGGRGREGGGGGGGGEGE